MARSTAGLTEPDIAELQRQLADGKRPRVRLSGPHFPVATAGTVVRIGTPAADGADFVRVRVKVNGMTDELAFAPSELSLPGRAAKAGSARRPAKAASGRSAGTGGKPAGRPAAARPARTRTAPAASSPAVRSSQPASGQPEPEAAARPNAAVTDQPQPEPQAAAQPKPARRAALPRGRKPAAAKVSFTVSSAGANWSLTATRGAKNLVRGASLPPGVVGALAELLGQPALSEAVSEINDAALAEARARADQLRAELDQLEAVLALHRRP